MYTTRPAHGLIRACNKSAFHPATPYRHGSQGTQLRTRVRCLGDHRGAVWASACAHASAPAVADTSSTASLSTAVPTCVSAVSVSSVSSNTNVDPAWNHNIVSTAEDVDSGPNPSDRHAFARQLLRALADHTLEAGSDSCKQLGVKLISNAPTVPQGWTVLETNIAAQVQQGRTPSQALLSHFSPHKVMTPTTAGAQGCRCQLSRCTEGYVFEDRQLNNFIMQLFATITSEWRTHPDIPKVQLSRYDLFHGHLVWIQGDSHEDMQSYHSHDSEKSLAHNSQHIECSSAQPAARFSNTQQYDKRRNKRRKIGETCADVQAHHNLSSGLALLLHCQEYPMHCPDTFPYNLGWCQEGSPLRHQHEHFKLRNVLWFQGKLAFLDAGPGSEVHDKLLWTETKPLYTIYESDLGTPIADVNLLLTQPQQETTQVDVYEKAASSDTNNTPQGSFDVVMRSAHLQHISTMAPAVLPELPLSGLDLDNARYDMFKYDDSMDMNMALRNAMINPPWWLGVMTPDVITHVIHSQVQMDMHTAHETTGYCSDHSECTAFDEHNSRNAVVDSCTGDCSEAAIVDSSSEGNNYTYQQTSELQSSAYSIILREEIFETGQQTVSCAWSSLLHASDTDMAALVNDNQCSISDLRLVSQLIICCDD